MSTLDFLDSVTDPRQRLALCDEERAKHLARMTEILDSAKGDNRDLTSKEQGEFNQAEATVRVIDAAAESARAKDRREIAANERITEMLRTGMVRFGEDCGHSGRTMQTDSRGRNFAILAKSDKATDYLQPTCENAIGWYIGSKLFGSSRATPQAIKNAMSESDNTVGGFLVGNPMMSEVIDLARAKSVLMRAGVRTILMDSESLVIPKLESDLTVTNKAEGAAWTASDLTFGQRELSTHTAGAFTKISRELWEDAPGLLAEQIGSWLASAMAQQIDRWGIQGTGSAQPTGLVNVAEIDSTGSIGAIQWSDISAAVTAIRNANHEPNAVLLYPEVHDDLMTSVTGDAVNAAKNWLGPPPTLEGKLFLPSTNVPLANAVIGDFSKYAMGLRTTARVEASTTAGEAFERHQVYVKVVMRYDFVTLDDSAFHVLTGITS